MLQKTKPPAELTLGLRDLMRLLPFAVRAPFDRGAILQALDSLATYDADRLTIEAKGRTFTLLRHPADIAAVVSSPTHMVGHSRYQKSTTGIRSGEKIITNSEGEDWKALRKSYAAFMGQKGLKLGFTEAAQGDVAAYIATLQDQPAFNVEAVASHITLKYMFRSIFNLRVQGDEAYALIDSAAGVHKYLFWRVGTFAKLPKDWIKSASGVNAFTAAGDRIIDRIVAEYIAAPPEIRERHVFSKILAAHQQDDKSLEASTLARALTGELIVAGHLNTRTSLYWALHHLARQPALQEKIRAESQNGLPSFRPAADGTMPTAAKFILETMRLHPAAFVYIKEIKQDFTSEAGLKMKAGTTVVIPPWMVHRDPRFYENPLVFDPETQWSPEAMRARDRHAYLPFGHGPHNCLGSGVSLELLCSSLAQVATQLRLRPAAGEPLPPDRADVFLRPEQHSRLQISPQ